ncbi:hypothetical protein DI392_13620 [Vibrio albus]|uniref:Uncharacterized protein n=1 Tax=Vibrio albus TaxID=2200953 RepID=A0A2U3B7U6_9VIBR|nr:hypothetical protein [Vibrio albus]PWI32852.1 hypothetical protein DI392_13620 [Vibrio albus]
MNMNNDEKNAFRDFVKFLKTKPVVPDRRVDDAILQMVEKDLCLPVWQIYAKMLFISVSTGLMSLTVCPQFGIGQETFIFQSLHATGSDIVLHLFCGLFFVTVGASVSAAVLKRSEIQAISQLKYAFFLGYSFVSFTLLIAFGKDAFVISSLFWVLGAILGNILGFESVVKLRLAWE